MGECLTGSDKKVQLVRDHSHARILYKLWRDLDRERSDSIYSEDEKKQLKRAVSILSRKEDKLKNKHNHIEWGKLGNYELFR